MNLCESLGFDTYCNPIQNTIQVKETPLPELVQ